MWVAKLKP